MKLKTKLLLGFSSMMLLLLLLTMVGYDRLDYMNKQFNNVYEDRYIKVRSSTGMRGEVNKVSRFMANLLLNEDKNAAPSVKDQQNINTSITDAENYLKVMVNSNNSIEEKQMLDRVQLAWAQFDSYLDKEMVLLSKGMKEEAIAYRDNTGLPTQLEALESLNVLATYQDRMVDEATKNANAEYNRSIQITTIIMVVGLMLGLGIIMWIIPSITKGLNTVNMMIKSFGKGHIRTIRRLKVTSKDEIGDVARVFIQMAEDIEKQQELEKSYLEAQKDQNWLNSHTSQVTELLRGVNSLEQISQTFINEFTPVLGAHYGAVYIQGDDKRPNRLFQYGAYAGSVNVMTKDYIDIGEGLVGQCALDKKPIHIKEIPDQYLSIQSGLGDTSPRSLMIYPVLFEDELLGVVEVASLGQFTSLQRQLMSQLTGNLGIILNNIRRRLNVEELLRESQALTEELQCQSEELQTQQEELRRSNEHLEEQTTALKRSEGQLQSQQEELEQFNIELIAKSRTMEEQMQELEEKNYQIGKTSAQLEQQAVQLAITSKYKSEFLANMSHELRTPLNSLLILSQLLTENKGDNLTTKQIEYAQTIYMSGADLLKMIDEILDLSKVDAGKMEINQEMLKIKDLEVFVQQNFTPIADKRQIALNVQYGDELPEEILTDEHRVKQILRNLFTNAIKFTSSGYINFSMNRVLASELPNALKKDGEYIALSVKDTGIGIPQDKLGLIFEAFQQVDGTTSRKYGGTGLGLSISRELAGLLGGYVDVESKESKGSCFTLYLPIDSSSEVFSGEKEAAASHSEPFITSRIHRIDTDFMSNMKVELKEVTIAPLQDDRDLIEEQDKVLLIIEDDVKFAGILLEMARDRGFKTLLATQGDLGLKMAQQYLPSAIILDIQLPVMDGWSILGVLKNSALTRHIPVHIVSVVDDVKQGLRMGAIAYLQKPSSKDSLEKAFSYIESYTENSLKHLLIVEDDQIQRNAIIEFIDHDDVSITAASSGKEALQELRKQKYDCMVLDLMLTDMTGFELLDQIRDDKQLADLPIIIYTGKELNHQEEMILRKYTESIIIKDVRSPERLLDETTLFLHRVEANLPEDKREILQKLHNKETLFENKKILLVDDDIRNVFALSSVLESYHMEVVFAENGRDALDILEKQPDFDLILMDMMMPEMDGYEAMRQIRQIPEFQRLPIIALTAKAMKEDRSKCIEAGASDYVKKPIQTEQLLSLMRVWLYS
ncbi:response regulator [Paenibacillus macquariensis]|uniref:histidine kinase n=1 Tax=Paenibacillus macquariensis TaxID=948756 RepID=A0ABY1K8I0_9BACL|nr:response regulator [Paenibacillus macquariensis]MEC0093261.1 response regulator [Paenibacillus macquariensis]OAB27572.1 histidine kinase [Paenibacillus macquariensis subsp. macquariensis]SIR40905.1 Signal transduction histidine kinase [Paenibacillus macquariensis]